MFSGEREVRNGSRLIRGDAFDAVRNVLAFVHWRLN